MSEDRAENRKARREAAVKRREQLEQLGRFMSTPPGREYMYDLLASCHVYTTSFATNALAMAFREGERNIGLRLGADLTEASADLYLQMLKEADNVRRTPVRDDDNEPDERDA